MNDTCIFCGTSFPVEGNELAIRTENGIRIFGYEGIECDFICLKCSSRTIAEYADWQVSEHR